MIATSRCGLRRLPAVVSGAGLALVLSACGSQAADITDETASSPTVTQETSQASTPPEPTDPTEATDTPSTDSPAGDNIDGEGYTYAIPQGWEDVGDEPTSAQADSAVRVSDSGGSFGTNINIIITPSGGVTDLESLRDTFKRQIEGIVDSPVEEVDDVVIDGEPAIGQTASADQQGTKLVFTQYFVAHEDNIFAVTLTAPQAETENGTAALQSILSSWIWD